MEEPGIKNIEVLDSKTAIKCYIIYSSKSKEELEVPDSSSGKTLEKKQSEVPKVAKIVNGNHQESDSTTTEKKEAAEGVSSSSSVAQPENGEITSNNASSNVDSSVPSRPTVAGKNGLEAIYDSDDDDDDDSDDENYPQMDQGKFKYVKLVIRLKCYANSSQNWFLWPI